MAFNFDSGLVGYSLETGFYGRSILPGEYCIRYFTCIINLGRVGMMYM